MLDGVGYGLQVTLELPLRLRRRWGRWRVDALPESQRVERWGVDTVGDRNHHSLQRAESQRRAALPALVARGILAPERAAGTPLVEIVRRRSISVLRLWTGHVVRVAPNARLATLRATPRRCAQIDMPQSVTEAHLGWTPLVLEFELAGGGDELVVEGEIATLGVLPRAARVSECELAEAPHLARALLAFYSPEYFETKRRGEVARSYRRLPVEALGEGAATTRIALCGPRELAPSTLVGDVTAIEQRCAIELSVRFDGQRVRLSPDRDALARRARAIEAAWAPWATPEDPAHRGALLYLTRYMTPHPMGEPHFFVKPCALLETPPGWSTLIEGVSIAGVGETLRGVVRSDVFHALPAVFALPTSARSARIRRGELLAWLLPTPRAWTAPRLEERAFEAISLPRGPG